jgi:hypothetical protein
MEVRRGEAGRGTGSEFGVCVSESESISSSLVRSFALSDSSESSLLDSKACVAASFSSSDSTGCSLLSVSGVLP